MREEASQPQAVSHTPLQALSPFGRRAREILARWWEQPIGVVVPLVALIILLLVPQSADMFAAIDYVWSAFGFAIAAFFLAFSEVVRTTLSSLLQGESAAAQVSSSG